MASAKKKKKTNGKIPKTLRKSNDGLWKPKLQLNILKVLIMIVSCAIHNAVLRWDQSTVWILIVMDESEWQSNSEKFNTPPLLFKSA